MQLTALHAFLMLVILSIYKQIHVAAEPTFRIRLYTKSGWKGKYVQKEFEYGDCVNWFPNAGLHVVSAATQIAGFKCTVYDKNEHCHGDDAPFFYSSTYDTVSDGLPTFWRSFSCLLFDGNPNGALGGNDTSNEHSDALSIEVRRSTEFQDNENNDFEPEIDLSPRDELAEAERGSNSSAGEKWNCPAGVAGVPYNHCVGNIGSRTIQSGLLTLVVAAGAVYAA